LFNKIIWAFILTLVLILGNLGCAKPAAPLTPSAVNTAPQAGSTAPKPGSTASTAALTTLLTRPITGKAQELSFILKPPSSTQNLVIRLEKGETLNLVWKFVANPQAGINFMLSTPEGRELDSNLKPINMKGHPFYDQNLPDQKPEAVVGDSITTRVGSDNYCVAGYYTLVFSGNLAQSGSVYLSYTLQPTAAE
jgi:hypothetical protein